MPKFAPISVHDLGDYLREQRHTAKLTLRQLSEVAGISNPYISQIERGLKRPSAEILQALAKALRISAESLYIRAGILEELTERGEASFADVTEAILVDPRLNDRQRAVLLDVYESFVGEPVEKQAPEANKSLTSPAPKASPAPEGGQVSQASPVPEGSKVPQASPAPKASKATKATESVRRRPAPSAVRKQPDASETSTSPVTSTQNPQSDTKEKKS